MKKFTRTINGEKYQGNLFEESDIMNKFGKTKEDWELINTYQKTFPQLLLNDVEGFIIDGRTLWTELGVSKDFSDWVKGNIKSLELIENTDFKEYSPLKGIKKTKGKTARDYTFTLEVAKDIAMTTGTGKNSSEQLKENSKLVRKYFRLMENTLKDYETWVLIREPERQGYKDMKKAITEWYVRNGFESDIEAFYMREANLLNQSLTGMKAIDIRHLRNVKDNKTRDNLTKEVNQCLANLQFLNTSLLNSNMSYSIRKEVIESTCDNQYGYIKEMFKNK